MERDPDRRLRLLAYVIAAVVVAAHSVEPWLAAGLPQPLRSQTFNPMDTVIGVVWACAGLWVSVARPRVPVGWLLLAVGVLGAIEAAGSAYGLRALLATPQWHFHDLALSVVSGLWPAQLFLPLTLLLARYPSGSLTARWARWPDRAASAGMAAIAVGFMTSREAVDDWHRQAQPALALPEPVAGGLAVSGGLLLLGAAAVTTGHAVVRTVRARGPERAQLLLLLTTAALAAVLAFVSPWERLFDLGLVLVPLAMAVGVLRYGLLGIDVVVARALLYGTLTALVVAVYAATVALASQVVAAALVAVGLLPVHRRLQSVVEVVVYGARRDPLVALRQIGEETPSAPLEAIVRALAASLRLRYVAILDAAGSVRTATATEPGDGAVALPLADGLGSLLVSPRRGERVLTETDRRVLEVLAIHVTAVVRAADLAAEVEAARQHLLDATLVERARLRRELHDGLGPSLTGIGLGLEAAERALSTNPARAAELLARLREETVRAVDEVRRIIDALRPRALDEAGLVGALRQRAESVSAGGGPEVSVEVPRPLPPLKPEQELAAYRIAEEAMTNALRHSGGRRVSVRLTAQGRDLTVEVCDDGAGLPALPRQGLGLESMRRRAEECGGDLTLDGAAGLRVTARLPAGRP